MDMRTPKVAPKELRGVTLYDRNTYYRLALDKGIFGYTVPIICNKGIHCIL